MNFGCPLTKEDQNIKWRFKICFEAGNVIANTLNYGNFIAAVINFLILALVVFFLVKGINKVTDLTKKKEEPAPEPEAPAEPEPTKEELLLTEIRDLLKNK